MKSDISVREDKAKLVDPGKPKDEAEPKFTQDAGTKSDNGKYTCRSHQFNGGHFSVKPQG